MEKTQTPRITLDHIIKERYPTFVDALRDLDDALSMLFLFANLPSTATIPPKTIALCQRLCLEFEHYLIISHSLRKSFLSIKGIYYQATIQGQDIMWLVPYKFVQRVTGDIDFRIMGTFIEFYTTLLGFVNFRLYNGIGLIYPPKFNAGSDERGAELGAFTLEGKDIGTTQRLLHGTQEETSTPAQIEATSKAQAVANALATTSTTEPESQTPAPAEDDEAVESNGIDTFSAEAPDADILDQPTDGANTAATLFAPFTFFLSRETPRLPLEFLIKSFGCKRVGWDAVLGEGAHVTTENDPSITHQIVDRPPVMQVAADADGDADMTGVPRPGGRVPGRIYVQPQWVWDCINEGKLLRPDLYAPGATLPPHLSPWVRAARGAYDPTAPLEIGDEEEDDEEPEKDAGIVGGVDSVKAIADLTGAVDSGMDEDEDEEDEEDEEEDDGELQSGMFEASEDDIVSSDEEGTTAAPAQAEDFGGFSSDEDADDVHARELAAELSGKPLAPMTTKTKGKTLTPKQKEAAKAKKAKEEELERAKMMLSRKKRKQYERVEHSSSKTKAEAEKLRAKKRKIERGKQ